MARYRPQSRAKASSKALNIARRAETAHNMAIPGTSVSRKANNLENRALNTIARISGRNAPKKRRAK